MGFDILFIDKNFGTDTNVSWTPCAMVKWSSGKEVVLYKKRKRTVLSYVRWLRLRMKCKHCQHRLVQKDNNKWICHIIAGGFRAIRHCKKYEKIDEIADMIEAKDW